jgi:hypothetical protein
MYRIFKHNLYIHMHGIVRFNLLLSVVSYLVVSSLKMATSQNM